MLISKLKAQQMTFHDYKYRYVTNDTEVLAPFKKFCHIKNLSVFPKDVLPTTRYNGYSEYGR